MRIIKSALRFLGSCDFLSLFLFTIAANIIYLPNHFFPLNDSQAVFEIFYFFYNDLFWHNHLAQWMPYYGYGLPAGFFQLYALTPLSYIALVVGWLLKIQNALLLFKLSILAEQLVFVTGMYILCRFLFSRKSTAFIVCLAAIGSAFWYEQIFFDFRFYYLFPWTAYVLLMFFEKKQPAYFWLTGIVFLLWMTGNPLYCVVLWFFIFFIFFFVLWLKDKNILRCLFQRSRINSVLLGLFLFLSACYMFQLKSTLSFVQMGTRGEGGHNSLGIFLTYGGLPNISEFFKKFVTGTYEEYLGLLPAVFFVWALIFVRKNLRFWAFLSVTIALIWLSFGGIFALISYFFPALNYFRHIGLIYKLLSIPLLICAGFGWEHFVRSALKTKVCFLAIIVAIFVFLADACRITGEFLGNLSLSNAPLQEVLNQMHWETQLFRVGVYGVAVLIFCVVAFCLWINKKNAPLLKSPVLDKILMVSLVGAFVFDVVSFQYSTYKRFAPLPPSASYLESVNVDKTVYQVQREEIPSAGRQKLAWELSTRPGGSLYTSAYGFLQFDPCKTKFRIDLRPINAFKLLDATKEGQEMAAVVGCQSPKMRFISSPMFVATKEEAIQRLQENKFSADVLVLEENMSQDDQQKISQNKGRLAEQFDLHVTDFSTDRITAKVGTQGPRGSWLVYADNYHPGWQAMIDGQKQHVYPANVAFKAIYVSPGQHQVTWIYHYWPSCMASYLIFLFELLAGLLFLIILMKVLFASLLNRPLF